MASLENVWEIEKFEWGEKEGHLFEAVTKIFTARWFSRAWCAHEFWMGRKIFSFSHQSQLTRRLQLATMVLPQLSGSTIHS
jgi:hypothetical protein